MKLKVINFKYRRSKMSRAQKKLVVCFSLFCGISIFLNADVKLPAVIGNGMVLQRNAKVPIWGWADHGETVKVSFRGQTLSTVADKDGIWMVKLAPMKACARPTKMIVKGNNSITLANVLVGDVWICSGQSNMGMSVKSSMNAEKEIKNANNPKIRLFKVPLVSSFTPRTNIDKNLVRWNVCSPRNIQYFSAVGYFFGREVFKNLKVPVGLIQAAWAGTPALAWTSAKGLGNFKHHVERYEKYRKKREKKLGFQIGDSEKMQDWARTKYEYRRKKEKLPKRLYNAQGVYRRIPTNLFNGMIAPIIPFAIRGVIWYQGEDDVGKAYSYRNLFRNLIRDWRKNWRQGDFPFYYVQLANWNAPHTLSYAELRGSQSAVLDEPNVGMAVTVDIGNPDNVHPKNKQEVGRRLALNALAKTYGRKVAFSGPVYESMKVEGNKIKLKFKNTYGCLIAKGSKLTGFTIAKEKMEIEEIQRSRKRPGKTVKVRKFYPAKATIAGNTIVVWSDKVDHPAAVRYGWANAPVCNLYNKAGLPASPFRTDKEKFLW
jgi:sialate O-acetylesterase